MKIDEAREKILAIFSDATSVSLKDGELPDTFMVDFIERTISVCGPKYFKNEYDKEEVLNCLETLKESIDSYKKTTQNFNNITESHLPEIGKIIDMGHDSEAQKASSKLKSIQKVLKEEIILAGNAIDLFQEQIEVIRKISHFDAVTKLRNAYSFVNDLLPILKIGAHRDLDMGLMMMEISNYETILGDHNDTVYNKVLIYLTKILKSNIRTENKIYKYNHNTFLVLFNRSKESDLKNTKKRLLSQIGKHVIEYNNKNVPLTICCARINHMSGDTIDSMIARLQKTKTCVRQD